MRASPTWFIVIPVIALLSMQLSGLHMHVNPDGAGGLHGTHVHEMVSAGHGHDHDHEYDTDVSLFELGTSWGNLILFLLPLLFIFFTFVRSGRIVCRLVADTFQRRHHSRWRPPLRAPPLSLS
jgi:hypothetical protein